MVHRPVVYKITNLVTTDFYIGSTVNWRKRIKDHKRALIKNSHHSIKLQRAWNKYSEANFVFEILLYCDPENCLMYEQIALDHFKPKYNICQIAGSSLGRRMSRATKEKISHSNRGKLAGKNNPMYGKRRYEMSVRQQGSLNARSKLTHTEVVQIRDLLHQQILTQRQIADRFKVSRITICDIKLQRTWRNV